MKKFYPVLAAGALLALASTAFAAQPLQLSDQQMAGITAGGSATAENGGLAIGDFTADHVGETATEVNLVTSPAIAVGEAYDSSLAASLLFQALAVSHADSSASLP
jgi:hypothetical protein